MAFLALLLLTAWATGAWAEAFQGKVIGVADGDTITVLHERRPETIRLNGIDAPEKGQAFGERAKQFTAQLTYPVKHRAGREGGDVCSAAPSFSRLASSHPSAEHAPPGARPSYNRNRRSARMRQPVT